MENKNSKKKPFFATFLEKQLKDPETVKGGSVTSLLLDDVTTALKDGVTKPDNDNVTMKYPSDGDDDVLEVQ
ncbi:microviridin/marinostatin family tricyclic proteinase inhibitor [Chryseobacterium sp. PMSZPI]|uniref:microviridin/marinostatin family tricyclic proteinase inhibitor n=1 Tax=Chryseobacterium sp. PMSZPI TaxID=1033900 RepID=UPI000C3225B7|nr:microviridin/marinostatin family tricyclic proteinase inhibitor [Chryseobacterium sp. PMSZPI]PKF73990.1 serine endopeptidase [Chryseobacterium sp. PMSZPI]